MHTVGHTAPFCVTHTLMPSRYSNNPSMQGSYLFHLVSWLAGYGPSSPVAPAGMAAPAGPFQPMHSYGPLPHPTPVGPFHPMHPGAPLQHPMGAPPQQAVQDEDFAADKYHLDAEYALQQQTDDFQFGPQNEYLNPQEVQVSLQKDSECALLCCMWSAWGRAVLSIEA